MADLRFETDMRVVRIEDAQVRAYGRTDVEVTAEGFPGCRVSYVCAVKNAPAVGQYVHVTIKHDIDGTPK